MYNFLKDNQIILNNYYECVAAFKLRGALPLRNRAICI